MTQPFPQKIQDAMPSDNELVIGTVVSGNPLIVNARGGEQMPGRLSTTGLVADDTVALLREGATWLVLGKMIGGDATGLGLTSLHIATQGPGVLGLTAAEQDVPGTTINFTTTAPAANVVAFWFGDYEVIAASTATGVTMLRIDGVTNTVPAATFKQLANTERATAGQFDLITVPPGDHTAVLRANRVGGADGQLRLDQNHTQLLLAVFE
jgi:hypothetical protein